MELYRSKMVLCIFFILEELTGPNVLLSIIKYSFILKNKFKLLNTPTEQPYVKDIYRYILQFAVETQCKLCDCFNRYRSQTQQI